MSANINQINPFCTACKCHETARTVCLKGKTNKRSNLVIFSDYPDYFADNAGRAYALDSGKILDWMLARMSVSPSDVSYEYTIRCYPKDTLPSTKAGRAECIAECAEYRFATIAKLKPKSIAVLGELSLEAFTGKTRIGQYEGQQVRAWEPVVADYCTQVWIGYGLTYILMFPSDSYRVFRTIFMAAKEAGLNPVIDPTVKPFKWNGVI